MRSPACWTAALLAITQLATAFPQQGAVDANELFGRAAYCAGGQACGYSSQLCCVQGGCYTDANQQAQCKTYYSPGAAQGGYYTTATTTYTAQGPYLVTSTYTTYIAGSTPAPTGVAVCNAQLNQQSCGNICCGSNQYCSTVISGAGSCAAYTAGSTGFAMTYTSIMYATTDSAGVPVRPTASTLVVVTVTNSAASSGVTGTIEPFQTPITTGSNVTVTSAQSTNGGGLSGGAIAGIVIGVLIALLILGLICFCCCLKGLVDGCLAIFGLGRKRKEVDIYERRTHHSSSGAPGRTWYGAPKPARPERRNSEVKNVLGIGAGLAALWAILGLKRRNERRKNEEKQSEYSDYSSYYYTSESSQSSRPTRDDRRSRR